MNRLLQAIENYLAALDAPLDTLESQGDSGWHHRYQSALSNLRAAIKAEKREERRRVPR